jgi:hypothetical protein
MALQSVRVSSVVVKESRGRNDVARLCADKNLHSEQIGGHKKSQEKRTPISGYSKQEHPTTGSP